ncbi:MAG: multiheme c-type cytochrome [Myxococcota bacterium]|nr:multiheme c-type cytochrome [Myxococcota bacterium]
MRGWSAWWMVLALIASGCRSQPGTTATVITEEVRPTRAPSSGDASLILMADIGGVLKPCGCTVDLQKGGFDRLKPFVDAERARTEHILLLHAGPVFFESHHDDPNKAPQKARQSEVVAQLVGEVGIDIAGLSAHDISAARDGIKGGIKGLIDDARLKMVTGNVSASATGVEAPAYRVEQVGDLRVGVFSLTNTAEGVEVADARTNAEQIVEKLKVEADVIVLLSGLGLRNTKRLLRAVPGIHFAVAGGLGDQPVASDEAELVGDSRLVQFHREGRYIGRLKLHMVAGSTDFVDASAPGQDEVKDLEQRITQLEQDLARWKTDRDPADRAVRSASHHLEVLKKTRANIEGADTSVPEGRSYFSFRSTSLEWDLPQDPGVVTVMDAFNEELKQIHLANAGTLPEPVPGQALYVGQQECIDCHEETETFWANDRHPLAWETLEDDGKTFDAGCVSCHVTGYGEASGSLVGQTEGREDVQCEACHGPGSLHVEADGEGHIVRDPGEEVCTTCHNAKHSPKFDYQKWKKQIVVP